MYGYPACRQNCFICLLFKKDYKNTKTYQENIGNKKNNSCNKTKTQKCESPIPCPVTLFILLLSDSGFYFSANFIYVQRFL